MKRCGIHGLGLLTLILCVAGKSTADGLDKSDDPETSITLKENTPESIQKAVQNSEKLRTICRKVLERSSIGTSSNDDLHPNRAAAIAHWLKSAQVIAPWFDDSPTRTIEIQPKLGRVGCFSLQFDVLQVIDQNNMRVGDADYPDRFNYWIRGISTDGFVDGQKVEGLGPQRDQFSFRGRAFYISGTKTYPTTDGGTETVFVFEPISKWFASDASH